MISSFREIEKRLSENRIFLDVGSIISHSSMGMMSDVYIANSSIGKLLIKIINPLDEQKRQKIHLKIKGVSDLLRKHPKVPSAEVLMSGELSDNKLFTVDKFIEGKVLGGVTWVEGRRTYNFFVDDANKHINQLKHILAELHQIPINGFGFLTVDEDKLRGEYSSWVLFLKENSEYSLRNLFEYSEKNEKFLSETEFKQISESLDDFFKKNSSAFECNEGKLIHGDMINPGNVIIDSDKIMAIIDFEWAASGDPAWEFSRNPTDNLDEYFEHLNQIGMPISDKELFKKKVELYSVLNFLWIACVLKTKSEARNRSLIIFKKGLMRNAKE